MDECNYKEKRSGEKLAYGGGKKRGRGRSSIKDKKQKRTEG